MRSLSASMINTLPLSPLGGEGQGEGAPCAEVEEEIALASPSPARDAAASRLPSPSEGERGYGALISRLHLFQRRHPADRFGRASSVLRSRLGLLPPAERFQNPLRRRPV